MVRRVLVVLLLTCAALAGCSGDPRTDDAPEPEAFAGVEVTDSTGAIRGVVVTEAIVPLEGALVSLRDGRNQTTDAEGAFVFNGLEPGDYFLEASMDGYVTQQASAVVVAGDAEPPITKITMLSSGVLTAYTSLQQWSAFLQCGVNVLAVSLNPCAFTGSDNVHDFVFDPGKVPDFAQAEAVWTGTQPAGNWLWLQIHDPATTNGNCKMVNAQSPAILTMNQTEIIDCWGEEADHMTYKVFPGNSEDTPPVPTFLTNQQYDIYVQYFYGFVPREGYSLVVDGVCDTPDKCS